MYRTDFPHCCSVGIIEGFPNDRGYGQDTAIPQDVDKMVAAILAAEKTQYLTKTEETYGQYLPGQAWIATVNTWSQPSAMKALEKAGYTKVGEFPTIHPEGHGGRKGSGNYTIAMYVKGVK